MSNTRTQKSEGNTGTQKSEGNTGTQDAQRCIKNNDLCTNAERATFGLSMAKAALRTMLPSLLCTAVSMDLKDVAIIAMQHCSEHGAVARRGTLASDDAATERATTAASASDWAPLTPT